MSNSQETSPSAAPRDEYERRLAARRAEVQRLQRTECLAGNGRVVTFLAIAAALYVLVRFGQATLPLLLATLAAFIAAVAWHRRVLRALERSGRAVGYYARALARLDGRWAGVGADGREFASPEHRYAKDLDLFGHASLYQLLCAARTRMGKEALADWLRGPAEPRVIVARQKAIAELRTQIDLREELAVLEGPLESEIKPKTLTAWLSMPPLLVDSVRPWLAVVFAAAAVTTLALWIYFGAGSTWFLLAAILEALLLRTIRKRIGELTTDLDAVLDELELLADVLRIMKVRKFDSALLAEIHVRLDAGGQAASRHVAHLARLVGSWETFRLNKFVAPLGFLLMLPVHLAYAIDRWRRTHARLAAAWLEACGQFEALCSFAGYAYEQPGHVVPEIVEAGPELEATGLGHPLIAAARRVCNDVRMASQPQLLLVSGSNMSGKSTLLRTVGINTVLALAGAPVCAARMRVSPLVVASAMRTVDSLQDGVPGFYAEIQRLRMICDLAAGPPPVLFLLDEILHGTNSHDRRIGAEAVLDNLLRRGAIGLVTTHDLALAEIAAKRGPAARNVHFEDQVTDGRISFDYRLRDGVVPKGNGLALMRLLGFEVAG